MKMMFYCTALILLLLMVGGFYYSPYYSLQQVDQAIVQNDAERLQEHVQLVTLGELAETFVRGKLTLKMKIEGQKDMPSAMLDYSFALGFVKQAVDSLLTPYGFPELLKGNLEYIDPRRVKKTPDTVLADVDIIFDSLTEAHFFVKQAQGLKTRVLLKRVGLFDWKIDNLVYPVEDMLNIFVKNLQQS